VDSAILRLAVRSELAAGVTDPAALFRVVRAGFGQKRKQLRNSLAAGLALAPQVVVAALEQAGIDPKRRAETLAIDEWWALTRSVGLQV
jgi:16S rRNA (adenine1518-N6/adenine1519-N6)-dimethyltransferase